MVDFLTALRSFIDAKAFLDQLQHLQAEHRRAFIAAGGDDLLEQAIANLQSAASAMDLVWQVLDR